MIMFCACVVSAGAPTFSSCAQPNVDLLVNRIVENAINIVPCENAAIFFRGKTALGQEHVW
jgi:hypothetical protein